MADESKTNPKTPRLTFTTSNTVGNDKTLVVWPRFLGTRLQQLVRRLAESGLRQHVEAALANRRALNMVWLEQSDAACRAMMVDHNVNEWFDLAVVWGAMCAFSVCIWVAECVYTYLKKKNKTN